MSITTFDKNMTAVAFAEAGEHDTARQILGENATRQHGKSPAPAAKADWVSTDKGSRANMSISSNFFIAGISPVCKPVG